MYFVMKRNRNIKESMNKAQTKFELLKYRYLPYWVIAVFSIAATFVRLYILPDWGIGIHFLMFLVQVVTLTIIWQLVKKLNSFLDKRIPFEDGAITRVILQIALTLLIVGPVFTAIFIVGNRSVPQFATREFTGIAIIVFIVVIFLFNFAFYAYHFFGNWQDSVEAKAQLEVQAAQLEKEKFNLQYHQLRNQVNPHYLFNTLTSLDGLIHTNPELASRFVRHMAKVYRYVLQHKESEVVNLDEELDFIQHYIQLLHIRYSDGLKITTDVSEKAKDKGVVMVTLQMLIDNAIKHNIVQTNEPLHISISDEADYLIVKNNKQLRRQIDSSNGQGIRQLKQLYSYLTEKQVVVEETNSEYAIKVPLL